MSALQGRRYLHVVTTPRGVFPESPPLRSENYWAKHGPGRGDQWPETMLAKVISCYDIRNYRDRSRHPSQCDRLPHANQLTMDIRTNPGGLSTEIASVLQPPQRARCESRPGFRSLRMIGRMCLARFAFAAPGGSSVAPHIPDRD